MAAPLLKLVLTIINLYWWVIIATAVMSWLVAFQVVDKGEPGSVRSGWGRPIPGVMRPLCKWDTHDDPGMMRETLKLGGLSGGS